jgi:hypothetical protein
MVTYHLQSYKVSLVICSPWQITPVAPTAGYNENRTFYFAGTTFITVRQNQTAESRKTHEHISCGENRYSKFSLFHEESTKHI